MKPRVRDRASDVAVMLGVVSISVVTWACLCDAAGVAVWKSYAIVGTALLCGLAALTRNPRRAATARALMGVWMVLVPYLLGVSGPAREVYMVIGLLVMTTAVPSYYRIGKTAFAPHGGDPVWLQAER